MRPAYLSCLDCPPSGSLCVLPLSKCLFASSIRGDRKPNKQKGRGKQSGFLCSFSRRSKKNSSLLSVPPASFCALPTCFCYVFRLPEMCGAGTTHNNFTSQLLLMRSRRGDATRQNFFLLLLVRYVSMCYTTIVAILEGKSSTQDADFDISKLALVIRSGTILLGGDSPPSLRREMAVSLSVTAFLLFLHLLPFISLSLSLALSRSLCTCLFLVSLTSVSLL